jgi:hypothetical protein
VSLLVYFTIELLMAFHLSDIQIYSALSKCCLLTHQEAVEFSPFYFLSDFFDDEQSIRKLASLFIETHLGSKKLRELMLNFLL